MGALAKALREHRVLLRRFQTGSTPERLNAQAQLRTNLDALVAALEIPEEQWDSEDQGSYQWILRNDPS